MADMDRLDEIVRELAALSGELGASSQERRTEIEARQSELRIEAARLRETIAPRSEADLKAELYQLKARLDDVYRDRIDVIAQAGGGSAGGDFGLATDAAQLNRHIDAVSGKAEIEARIRALRAALDSRAGE